MFKSISQLEKTVETASIATGDDNDHISFKLNCKFGVVKTFKISLLEGEELKVSMKPRPFYAIPLPLPYFSLVTIPPVPHTASKPHPSCSTKPL